MSSDLLQVFFQLGNLHGTSNYALLWILGYYILNVLTLARITTIMYDFFYLCSYSDLKKKYLPKRYGNNNKDEDNSPKNLNDKNQQASSQKFRQLTHF